MIKSTVVLEDKDGNEHVGQALSHTDLKEDQLVTAKTAAGSYISGYILEIKGVTYEG